MHSALVHMLHLHLHMLADCLSAFVLQKEAIELANAYGNVFVFFCFFISLWPYFYFFSKAFTGPLCGDDQLQDIFQKDTVAPFQKLPVVNQILNPRQLAEKE